MLGGFVAVGGGRGSGPHYSTHLLSRGGTLVPFSHLPRKAPLSLRPIPHWSVTGSPLPSHRIPFREL